MKVVQRHLILMIKLLCGILSHAAAVGINYELFYLNSVELEGNETGRLLWTHSYFTKRFYCCDCLAPLTSVNGHQQVPCPKQNNILAQHEIDNQLYPYCRCDEGKLPVCPPLPVARHGAWICGEAYTYNGDLFRFDFTKVPPYIKCRLVCDSGYAPSGPDLLRCGESRSWNASAVRCEYVNTTTTAPQSSQNKTVPVEMVLELSNGNKMLPIYIGIAVVVVVIICIIVVCYMKRKKKMQSVENSSAQIGDVELVTVPKQDSSITKKKRLFTVDQPTETDPMLLSSDSPAHSPSEEMSRENTLTDLSLARRTLESSERTLSDIINSSAADNTKNNSIALQKRDNRNQDQPIPHDSNSLADRRCPSGRSSIQSLGPPLVLGSLENSECIN